MFWGNVRSRLKTKSGVAPLIKDVKDKNSAQFDDVENDNILQDQFSSVFTREPEGETPSLNKRTDASSGNLHISYKIVQEEINNLNVNKSCGPDEAHPRMLIELVDDIISKPISELLNRTMEDGHLPIDWRKAYVSPIYIKAAINVAANPASHTSTVCEIMEKFVKVMVLGHLTNHDLLSPRQYGFISGRSTVTQLLCYLEECIEIIVGKVSWILFIWIVAKAFDTVPHQRLINELNSYSIIGNILNWITSFLSNRSQIVRVNGAHSKSSQVISGIPQGSVLGPILFVIYINDLSDAVNSSKFLFADDTKILRQITTRHDNERFRLVRGLVRKVVTKVQPR